MAHKALSNLRQQRQEQVLQMEDNFEDGDDPLMHIEPSFGQPATRANQTGSLVQNEQPVSESFHW